VPDISTLESLARLTLAAGLGGAIGLERELRDHEAGLRTHMLVALGAALFTLVSAYAWTDWTFSAASGVTLDPTRIAAQIVSGIGFLGAGAIIVRGISVKGLTTAASVWVVAAIGMASGAGFYLEAVGATAIALVSLYPLRIWSRHLAPRSRADRGTLRVEVENGGRALVIEQAERLCGRPVHLEVANETVTLAISAGRDVTRLVTTISRLEGVRRVEWAP
jgi:putative Mg2+ transporter-C (MgtC) family protein